ncbi:MAG: twin-arginine translocation signal domain-containing protein, partial [Dehalococcoidia bacterium]
MEISRRDFFKLSGATAGGVALFGILPKDKALAAMPKTIPLRKRIGESLTICPYDASGCGFIIAADGENVI